MARSKASAKTTEATGEEAYELGYAGVRVDPNDDSRYQADSSDHPTAAESHKAALERRAEATEEAAASPASSGD